MARASLLEIMMIYKVEAIGFVKAKRVVKEDDCWGDEQSCIKLSGRYTDNALQGLEQFSHIEVLFLFHQVVESAVVEGARHPRNNPAWPQVGIFAQRGKNRPNRIGSTICRLLSVSGTQLMVSELDAIDGTPILDIKPVMSAFLPRDKISQPQWTDEIMQNYWTTKR
jgi:tRNA (adenine37-N6)-methyltransferase